VDADIRLPRSLLPIVDDGSGNVYVTSVTNPGAGNDFGRIKYDNDGHRQWFLLYDGPANGNDTAIAIAVAPDGAIYVTGYSTNALKLLNS